MKKLFTAFAVLATMCLATSAFATQYPPGPSNCCPDTLTIINIQNPAAVPHPVLPDTVRGVGGIITGFDAIPTGFGFYIQMSNGLPYSGVDVFTGATNKQAQLGLALGDSVVISYGKCQEFGGGTEIEGLDNSQSTDDVFVRKVSSGNPLPAFHVGTLAELQELPTNPFAEQWEGMLVQLNGTFKVARTSLTGGMGTGNSFMIVDPACSGPVCDSVFVDGNTLTTYTPPAVNQSLSMVQGIYEQRSRGYRIQLRNGNDLTVATPPGVLDAYMIDNNKIRVEYDRNVTTASATNLANYSLSSFTGLTGAVMDGQSNVVLTTASNLTAGDPEAITINNIVGLANGLVMTTPAVRNFTAGILTPKMIQGPNADSLVAAGGCKDVANYLGGNNGGLSRITVRGVCAGIQGSLYTLQNLDGGIRGGVAIFAPTVPLQVNHKYLVVGALQEFPSPSSGETEVVGTRYIVDEGTVASLPYPPVDLTVAQARDTTCDVTNTILNGEDVEGTIARVLYGRIRAKATAHTAGGNFTLEDLNGNPGDTLFVANNISRTFLPTTGNVVSVTGIMQFSFGNFRIQPRGDFDIQDHGVVTGVPGVKPAKVTFAVAPNPARTANVSFGLPVRNTVDLGVYDLQGRKVATLARGSYEPGTYSKAWNGLDDSGNAVGAGVYFYRLRVGVETFTLQGIKLN